MKRRNGDAVLGHRVPGVVMHEMPADLLTALIANSTALAAWQDITPLAGNEFICWVLDAKQTSTRGRRIRRTQEELEDRSTPALLLARMQTPRSQRQVASRTSAAARRATTHRF